MSQPATAAAPPHARSAAWLAAPATVAVTFMALGVGPLTLGTMDVAGHDTQRILQLLLLSALAPLAAIGAMRVHRCRRLTWCIGLALAALGLLAIGHAPVVRAAALEAGLLVAMALCALAIADAAGRQGLRTLLVIPLVASLLFAFVVAVRYAAALAGGFAVLREHLLPAYSNYRFFNHVQTVTIPLLAAVMLALPARLRGWAAAALVTEFALLFFTGGRATMVALGAAAAVVAAVFGARAAPWLVRLGAGALAGAALYLVLFEAIPRWLGLPRDFFTGDAIARSALGVGGPREYLWALAAEYIRESPLLGIGPMHYAHRVNVEAAHPHNVYLQLASEWGVPFAVLVVGLAALGWFRLLRAARSCSDPDRRALGISLVAAGAASAVDGMFSGNFVMPMSQLWIAFAIGLSIAYVRSANASRTSAGGVAASPGTRWGILALTVASQIAIWQGVWPEILDVNARVDKVRAEIVHNVRDNPRIWSHGWFR